MTIPIDTSLLFCLYFKLSLDDCSSPRNRQALQCLPNPIIRIQLTGGNSVQPGVIIRFSYTSSLASFALLIRTKPLTIWYSVGILLVGEYTSVNKEWLTLTSIRNNWQGQSLSIILFIENKKTGTCKKWYVRWKSNFWDGSCLIFSPSTIQHMAVIKMLCKMECWVGVVA